MNTKLHSSVIFPEVFGGISEEDVVNHFAGKRFKKWTRSRAGSTASKSMSKNGDVVTITGSGGDVTLTASVTDGLGRIKRLKGKHSFITVMVERRRKMARAKDELYAEERKAIKFENREYLKEVMVRWDALHDRRHLVSPFADCFVDLNGQFNHPVKPRFLTYTRRNDRHVLYSLNKISFDSGTSSPVSRSMFGSSLTPYFSVQQDVMNYLHFRGDNAGGGTSLQSVVTGKMISIMRPYLTGAASKHLRQVHLHIDDPSKVIVHKKSEQTRRDENRSRGTPQGSEVDHETTCRRLQFDDELTVPWSSLLNNRDEKYELASLHLHCAAVASFELLKHLQHNCNILLHGGMFAVPTEFTNCTPKDLRLHRDSNDAESMFTQGCIVLKREKENGNSDSNLFQIPRDRCLVFETRGGAYIGQHEMKYGEPETRFVARYTSYIAGPFQDFKRQFGAIEPNRRTDHVEIVPRDLRSTSLISGSLIISEDTEVFIILLCAEVMHSQGIVHVLNETFHSVDDAISA